MKKLSKNILPESWALNKISKILITSSGGTPDTTQKDFWINGTVPWLNSGGLKDNIIDKPTGFITQLGLSNSSAKLFPKNSVVIALTGSNTGKVGLLNIECSTNQSVVGIFPNKLLHHKFIFYYFIAIKNQLVSQAVGSAQTHINKRIIDETLIPIPPLEHQNRIVQILDDASQKIQQIDLEAKKIELLENQAFKSFIFKNGEFYPSTQLKDFCTLSTEKIGNKWKGKRLIGVSNTTGITDLRISGKKSFENYKIVKPGCFIYNPMRVDIGSIAIWNGNEIALTSPDYVVFSTAENISPLLLLKFLKSQFGLSQINNNTQGSVRSRLYFKNLAELNFPFAGEKNQKKAELILHEFRHMKEESSKILNGLKIILENTFERVFIGDLTTKLDYVDTGYSLAEKMTIEKMNSIEFSKTKVFKSNKMKKTINKINVSKYIKDVFEGGRFTFEDLYNRSAMDYETLKSDLYHLIDKEIELDFDKIEEKMYFKTRSK